MDCYHCGSSISRGREVVREINGADHLMCCEGCATVAAVIHESGLEVYYRKRTSLPLPIDESIQSLPQTFAEIFDDATIHQQFVDSSGDCRTTHFIVHNMHCPTCVWLIETRLNSLPGIRQASINYRTQRLKVAWSPEQVHLSDIVRCVQNLGYGLVPYSSTALSETIRAQYQQLLKRLGVAGIFGMQIMVIAVALYASAWSSIDLAYEELFRRLSLLFVLPIMFYAAAPIFSGAWRDLQQRAATMDVPIALGLLAAFSASLVATVSGTGEIYYDSIAMFVFLQLIARFLEKSAYRRMTDRIASLSASSPSYANLLTSEHEMYSPQVIPALRLAVGDWVLIKPGEAVPADARVVSGSTKIDESLLTGESNPIQRNIGDALFGGSINISDTIVAQVTQPSTNSALAAIVQLLEDSLSEKPAGRRLTDRIAGYFVLAVLLIAGCVAGFWYGSGAADWISYPISVLIVACPCALALAVPTALTAAINAAAKRNILIAHPNAVQELARADTFLFDKTGTLTQSHSVLKQIETYRDMDRAEALHIAAALADHSDHTICRALTRARQRVESGADKVVMKHGGGIRGQLDGKDYCLGSRAFVHSHAPGGFKVLEPKEQAGLVAYLGDESGVLARFQFHNPLRDDAGRLIDQLKSLPVHLALVTGDRRSEADQVAAELGIDDIHWECSPEDKLNIIRGRQNHSKCVAMVGDGINDAPTLAVANVSVTPARSQHIAKTHADILLLDDRLELLLTARNLAEFTVTTMRYNTVWAIAYNLIGISLAAAGYVPPLAAAIGMSVSSVLVVGNSLRIMSYKQDTA